MLPMPDMPLQTKDMNRQRDPNPSLAKSMPSTVDIESQKGSFGWTEIQGISLPYLFRDGRHYISVRMVEMKILSQYPSNYPEELQNRPPLVSYFILPSEVKLLNEVNKDHCANQFGAQPFTTNDLIVELNHFLDFFKQVQACYPSVQLQEGHRMSQSSTSGTVCDGGWLQVNNTVVPYVWRHPYKYVPLQVIRHAAGLLKNVHIDGELCLQTECNFFNAICNDAGLTFTFDPTTRLISVHLLQCQRFQNGVRVKELPNANPFDYAEYKSEDELSKAPSQAVAPSLPSAPQFLPISEQRPAQPVNGLPIGPPNVSLYPTYRDMPNSTNTATNTKQGQQIPTYAGYYQHQTVSSAQSLTSSVSAMHTQPQSTSAPSVPGVNTQAMSAIQCLEQFQYSHIPGTATCGGAVSCPAPPPYPYPKKKVNQPNTTKQTQQTKSCQKRKQKHPTQHQVPHKRQHLQQTHNLSPYHPASSMQQTGVSQYQQFYQPQPVYPSGYSNQSQVRSYPVVGHNLQEGVLAPQSTVGSHPVQQQLYQQNQHYQASRQLQPSVMQQATLPGLAMQQQMVSQCRL